MPLAIETVDLVKRFPKGVGYRSLLMPHRRQYVTALRGVSIQVAPGQVFGLLGTNGAGKTTLLKVLAGLVLPNQGSAFIHGYDVARQTAQVKRHVGYVVTEERSFYWRLTGRQNLSFFGALNNIPRRELGARVAELARRLELEDALDTRVLYYSTGMRQKLAIARALLNNPSVLLMDEPTRSLDPVVADSLRSFIREEMVEGEGKTVVLATHNLAEARQMCDTIAVLDKGRVVACDTLQGLLGRASSARPVIVHVRHLPESATAMLRQLPGVHKITVSPSVNGNGLAALELLLDDPDTQVSAVLESIVRAGGKVSFCAPSELSLTDVLQQVLGRRD